MSCPHRFWPLLIRNPWDISHFYGKLSQLNQSFKNIILWFFKFHIFVLCIIFVFLCVISSFPFYCECNLNWSVSITIWFLLVKEISSKYVRKEIKGMKTLSMKRISAFLALNHHLVSKGTIEKQHHKLTDFLCLFHQNDHVQLFLIFFTMCTIHKAWCKRCFTCMNKKLEIPTSPFFIVGASVVVVTTTIMSQWTRE